MKSYEPETVANPLDVRKLMAKTCVITKDVKICATIIVIVGNAIAQNEETIAKKRYEKGLPDKGHAFKGLVFCYIWNVPLDLL